MGRAVAEAVVARGEATGAVHLVPLAFSGEAKDAVDVARVRVEIASVRDGDPRARLEALMAEHPGMIVVDYTLPAAVNANADLYVACGAPFVMGTTGGDREKLLADVRAARHHAVIAPQMGKQVVAFQAAMRLMAENFLGRSRGTPCPSRSRTRARRWTRAAPRRPSRVLQRARVRLRHRGRRAGAGPPTLRSTTARDGRPGGTPARARVPHVQARELRTRRSRSSSSTTCAGASTPREPSTPRSSSQKSPGGDVDAEKTVYDMIDVHLQGGGMVTN